MLKMFVQKTRDRNWRGGGACDINPPTLYVGRDDIYIYIYTNV